MQVVQGVYRSCRGCTGRVGGVLVVQGVYRSCRGCTCRAGGVQVVQGVYRSFSYFSKSLG